MESLQEHSIEGIPVIQNKQDFVISVFTISQIFRFTKYTKRLIVGFDESEEPIYNKEIQREIEPPRVNKISDFLINDPEATFPTNIVLHIPREIIVQQEENGGMLKISLADKVFSEMQKSDGNIFISIIDGQRRIRGIEIAIEELNQRIESLIKTLRTGSSSSIEEKLKYYQDRLSDLLNIQLVVSFFIDKSLEYQAMIFSTINRTQKRVSQNLVYSLFGLTTQDSPQKTALQIVLKLNGHPNSPFYKRIRLYGGSYSRDNSPPLSQATMVRSLVNLISENLRESENDRYKKRKELLKRSVKSNRFLPFRKLYAQDKDPLISDTLFFFFNSIRTSFKQNEKSFWDFEISSTTQTNIFHTTVGYDTLLKILVDILEKDSIDLAVYHTTVGYDTLLNQ